MKVKLGLLRVWTFATEPLDFFLLRSLSLFFSQLLAKETWRFLYRSFKEPRCARSGSCYRVALFSTARDLGEAFYGLEKRQQIVWLSIYELAGTKNSRKQKKTQNITNCASIKFLVSYPSGQLSCI